jgi:hypothetical protein
MTANFTTIVTIALISLSVAATSPLQSLAKGPADCPRGTHYVWSDPLEKTGGCAANNVPNCAEYNPINGQCVMCTKTFMLQQNEQGSRDCTYRYTMHIIIATFIIVLGILVLYIAKKYKEARAFDGDVFSPLAQNQDQGLYVPSNLKTPALFPDEDDKAFKADYKKGAKSQKPPVG